MPEGGFRLPVEDGSSEWLHHAHLAEYAFCDISTYDRVHELSETDTPDELRNLRILLVEDSPVVAAALKRHLDFEFAGRCLPLRATR
jgi:hypothetical protein